MNSTLQVVEALTRVTRHEIPLQPLYALLKRHILRGGLDLGLRYNARYGQEAFLEALVYTSLTRCALELGCDRLRSLGCTSPTGHSVRDTLRRKDVEEVEGEAQRMIGEMVGQSLEGPITLAVDLHKKPYYGARDDPYVVGGRLKASTTRFHAYATAYLVKEEMRFTLAATMVSPWEKPHQILDRLLTRVEKLVAVGQVVADAGFYSVACIRLLERRGISYTIHGEARGRRIKGVLMGLEKGLPHQGDAAWLGPHGLKSSVYGEVEVRLLAARPIEGQRLHVYAAPVGEARRARRVYGEYERRFGIDTSYRVIRKVWAWTRSKSPSLRAFLFTLAVLLYNLWVLTKTLGRTEGARGDRGQSHEKRRGMLMWFLTLVLTLSPLIGEVIHLA